MTQPFPTYATLGDWIAREALPFSVDSPGPFKAAVEKLIISLGDSVEVLGFGEPLHGGEDFLILRNRLFERLVEAHGYSAIAIESSFPRARLVNEYVAGRGPISYEEVQDAGFSHGFGRLDANRELVEWMRRYNAHPAHGVKLRFYGFDSPTEMTGTDSPRQLLYFVLDYLATIGGTDEPERRQRIESHLGQDAQWQNPEAMMDPAKAVGRSPAATALRIETEDLITELQLHRPELAAGSNEDRYWEAVQYAAAARGLLNYHAGLARTSSRRLVEGLGMRDAMMADNLAYLVSRERGRGKVLAFAHNHHLKRGQAEWRLGPHALAWWPAGAHLQALLGPGYRTIGSALGVSEANGIGHPEARTLEARLLAAPGPARFIPTYQGQGLPTEEIAAVAPRSGSAKNQSYFPLTSQSFTDFDWLAALNSTAFYRGWPPLPQGDTSPNKIGQ
jgi:erythromycin esterase-like protein